MTADTAITTGSNGGWECSEIPSPPLWILGRDGQFVIADDHLWIAREGVLSAEASSYSSRKARLDELAVIAVGQAPVSGECLLRPLLVGDDLSAPITAPSLETVTMGAEEYSKLLAWARREGISVVDTARGRRLRNLQDFVGESSVVKPPASESIAVGRDEQQTSEVVLSPTLTADQVTSGTGEGSEVDHGTDEQSQSAEVASSDNSGADAQAVEDWDPEALAVPLFARPFVADLNLILGAALDQFAGAATKLELIGRVKDDPAWGDLRLRNALQQAIQERWQLKCIDWHVVGDGWMAIGGGARDETEAVRRSELAAALALLAGAREGRSDIEVRDAGRIAHEELGPARYQVLGRRLFPQDRRKIAARVKGDRSVARSVAKPERTSTDRSDAATSRAEAAAAVVSAVASKIPVARKPGKAIFGTGSGPRARVCLDVAGFRTVAMVDLTSRRVTVTVGELKHAVFEDPTTAAAAVISRHDPGTDLTDDGLDCWLLDDGSGRTLREVVEA